MKLVFKMVCVGTLLAPALLTAETVAKDKVLVTGSNIPRKVKRIGHSTDSMFPLYVLDQREIRHSGASTVGQVLRRLPFTSGSAGR